MRLLFHDAEGAKDFAGFIDRNDLEVVLDFLGDVAEVIDIVGADQYESNYYTFQLAELTLMGY